MAEDTLKINILADVKDAVSGFAKMAAGGLAAYASIRGLIRLGKEMTQEFIESEASITKMTMALKITGQETPQAVREMNRLADAIAKTTTYTDEAARESEALLMQLGNLSTQGVQKLMPVLADFSASMGMDLVSAATLVGKAIEGNAGQLGRYGIKIKETTDVNERFNDILLQMNDKFGGMAKALAEDTLGGKLSNLKKTWGELKEEGGALLAEVLNPLADAVHAMFEYRNKSLRLNEGRVMLQQRYTTPEDSSEAQRQMQIYEELSESYAKTRVFDDERAEIRKRTNQLTEDYIRLLKAEKAALDDKGDILDDGSRRELEIQTALTKAYASTEVGQRDALQADIDFWTKAAMDAKEGKDKILMYLAELKIKYENLYGGTGTTTAPPNPYYGIGMDTGQPITGAAGRTVIQPMRDAFIPEDMPADIKAEIEGYTKAAEQAIDTTDYLKMSLADVEKEAMKLAETLGQQAFLSFFTGLGAAAAGGEDFAANLGKLVASLMAEAAKFAFVAGLRVMAEGGLPAVPLGLALIALSGGLAMGSGITTQMSSGKKDDIPSYDTGGYVPRTGLAMVHEGETVIPASGAKAAMPMPSKGITIIVQGSVFDADRMAMQIWRRLGR